MGVSTPGKSRTGRRLMLVEPQTEPEQDALLERPGRHAEMPDDPEIDRVARPQVFDRPIGQDLPVLR